MNGQFGPADSPAFPYDVIYRALLDTSPLHPLPTTYATPDSSEHISQATQPSCQDQRPYRKARDPTHRTARHPGADDGWRDRPPSTPDVRSGQGEDCGGSEEAVGEVEGGEEVIRIGVGLHSRSCGRLGTVPIALAYNLQERVTGVILDGMHSLSCWGSKLKI